MNGSKVVIGFVVSGVLVAGGLIAGYGLRGIRDPYTNVKQQVRNNLSDPSGAEFRKIRQGRTGFCGEVNAKNGTGGFIGFRPFHVVGDDQTGTAIFDQYLIALSCAP